MVIQSSRLTNCGKDIVDWIQRHKWTEWKTFIDRQHTDESRYLDLSPTHTHARTYTHTCVRTHTQHTGSLVENTRLIWAKMNSYHKRKLKMYNLLQESTWQPYQRKGDEWKIRTVIQFSVHLCLIHSHIVKKKQQLTKESVSTGLKHNINKHHQ